MFILKLIYHTHTHLNGISIAKNHFSGGDSNDIFMVINGFVCHETEQKVIHMYAPAYTLCMPTSNQLIISVLIKTLHQIYFNVDFVFQQRNYQFNLCRNTVIGNTFVATFTSS